MLFDTTNFPQRSQTNSVKWDAMKARFGRDDLLPLWVADMDFMSPPCIVDALRKAAEFGVYGYFSPPDSYQEAFINWERTRHGVAVEREWLRFSYGVIAGLYWAIGALTAPGDAIAILTPCYYPFINAVADTGRTLVCSELRHTPSGYTVDLADFERQVRDRQVKMFLLCSPHNPVGRVWREEELRGMLDICDRYGVLVVSDEIHQDIVLDGHTHLSCLRLTPNPERMILLTSASKTFNIAGLQNSFVVIPNAQLRDAFDAYTKAIHIKKGVSMGYIAAEAGYTGGAPWLVELTEYLQDNRDVLCARLRAALPEIGIDPLEGTYMIWVDLSAYVAPADLEDVVLNRARLAVDFGSWFWPQGQAPTDDAHIRINIATSRQNLMLAADRLTDAVQVYRAQQ